MNTLSTADSVFSYLEGFLNLERGTYNPREYRLERMERLLQAFGNPHRAYRVIHVAGSKGKGSVCAFSAYSCEAAGEHVGLYMSPHVMDYRERIGLLGPQYNPAFRDQLVVEAGQQIASYVGSLRGRGQDETLPTTFELLTLLAFLVFRLAGVTLAVVEVGLGGRLDATNLVTPDVTVITGIELEHTDYLGPTISSVAREKAGIIKPGVPLVLAPQPPEARETILAVAQERQSPVVIATDEVTISPGTVTADGTPVIIRCRDGCTVETVLRLNGTVQANNAAVAVLACRILLPHITAGQLAAGLSNAWLPGRTELLNLTPPVLLDGAHTPTSVRTVLEVASRIEPDRSRRVLVFGSVAGKQHRLMLEILAPEFARIIISRPGTFKQSNTGELYQTCLDMHADCRRADEMADALAEARLGDPALIAVTGSFHLVGEARRLLVAEEEQCPRTLLTEQL